MLNNRWTNRILRALKTEVVNGAEEALGDVTKDATHTIFDSGVEVKNKVQDNEKIMNYLQKENTSGHAHNLDMLLSSLNLNQHLREAVLTAEVAENAETFSYTISFPFGNKTIEFILSKRAVEKDVPQSPAKINE